MLKLIWMLMILVILYIILRIWVRDPNGKEKIMGLLTGKSKIDKERQIVQIIERESIIGSGVSVTLVEIGEDQFAVFNSNAGMSVEKIDVDKIEYQDVWEKGNIVNNTSRRKSMVGGSTNEN